ncbi:MAG TPA: polyphosphate kinase 1 [Thermomicrobiales bacterium]|nr:polyphosphate kinase 1 [Thermomicrobiales bacterium]
MAPKNRKEHRGERAEAKLRETGAGDGQAAEGGMLGRPRLLPDRVQLGDGFTLKLPRLDPDLYINRELSWLEFNRRVLEEVSERDKPLLERVKFAAIFADNLDGWFMIRVAGLKRKLAAGVTDPGPDGRTPAAQFAAVRRMVQELLDQHSALIREDLLPALRDEGIEMVRHQDLKRAERAYLARTFEDSIFPILTPQAIDRGRRFPHVSSGSLNLIVVLRSPAGSRFARVKIPATLSRLVRVTPTGDDATDAGGKAHLRLTWLEDVVAAHLERLFPGNDIVACYPFHVVRDADIDTEEDEDDTQDLMMLIRESLTQRTFGPIVSLMVDATMPEDVREWLVDQLHASDRDLHVVDGPLAAEDLMELTRLDRPDLLHPAFTPAPVDLSLAADTSEGTSEPNIFATLRERDILVHHPYQSFSTVVDFIRAASADPDVAAIKQTLYRIGKDSPLIPALIEARDDDTQVAVLVELRARFDEENNITWAEALESRGIHVAYGLAGLKTHCKATLVVRREDGGLIRYVHLGTGNYNATTARLYEDVGILTAREDLGSDVTELFNALTGFARQQRYEKLWVAPTDLRQRFLEAITREVAAHRETGKGRLVFKMNQLVDTTLIRALYAASRAGVQVDLVVRGICCLRPGVPGWSENIRVVSIVGRFLEHSRIYSFANGGRGSGDVYLGSADLMERNLDRRVEAVFPVEDPAIATHLREKVLPAYLRDTVNARGLQSDGTWLPIRPKDGDTPFDVQAWLASVYARDAPTLASPVTAPAPPRP